jgi:hypothetical protein
LTSPKSEPYASKTLLDACITSFTLSWLAKEVLIGGYFYLLYMLRLIQLQLLPDCLLAKWQVGAD